MGRESCTEQETLTIRKGDSMYKGLGPSYAVSWRRSLLIKKRGVDQMAKKNDAPEGSGKKASGIQKHLYVVAKSGEIWVGREMCTQK